MTLVETLQGSKGVVTGTGRVVERVQYQQRFKTRGIVSTILFVLVLEKAVRNQVDNSRVNICTRMTQKIAYADNVDIMVKTDL